MISERLPLDKFAETFSTATELSSVALGAKVSSVSDEFFAEASHLLLVESAPSLKGQFGPKGALFSGWETRRHNPEHDWCIIQLGTTGTIHGFDIDTSHFNGNEAPQVSVDGLFVHEGEAPSANDTNWVEILPKVHTGPNSRHLFRIPPTARMNYVKLNMYPDGGIARFRVYGQVSSVFPLKVEDSFDLAHVFAGGRVLQTSDQHFGVGSNLLLPGRGVDMSDGWETKRSRQAGHKDWAIIKLGDAGLLSHVEIDTANFMGNFPESCELHALYRSDAEVALGSIAEEEWTLVLPRTKLEPHRQHFFPLENVQKPYTHVRVTIYPDGGIKRVRIIGRRSCGAHPSETGTVNGTAAVGANDTVLSPIAKVAPSRECVISALPLTAESFRPFGQVIQAYSHINPDQSPNNTCITGANQGTATKYHKLALLESSYPSDVNASAGISVYRCTPIDLVNNGEWTIKLLERHPCTNQAFIPMGGQGAFTDGLDAPGTRYLVIVARSGQDGQPDLKSMRAFVASAGQGIMYDTGVWHHPMAVLDQPMDFACVETQVGNGHPLDCEIRSLEVTSPCYKVTVPMQ